MIFNLLVAIQIYLYLMKGSPLPRDSKGDHHLSHCKLYTEFKSQVTWTEDQQAMIHYL